MDNITTDDVKTILSNYSELESKVKKVLSDVEILHIWLVDDNHIKVNYGEECHGYYYTGYYYTDNYETFPIDLLNKTDAEITEYFRQRRIKEKEAAKLAEEKRKQQSLEDERKNELAELEHLKKKYES